MKRKAKGLLAAAAILAVVAVSAARIAWVNDNAVCVPEEQFEVGEWVDFDGAFVSSGKEQADGYALRVKNARIMSCQDYLRQYAGESGEDLSGEDGEVVVLEIGVSNDGSSDGYMNYKNWRLSPPSKSTTYYIDYDLWYQAIPSLAEGKGRFGVTEGTTKTIYVPFWHSDSYEANMQGGFSSAMRADVSRGGYEFIFAHIPRLSVSFEV
ncbi:MAG: hypothetical protein Q4Q56_03520 [Coriobacteriia bacterium]|nr:hypothetical protein [Coriobacteriia bacterium]